MNRLTHQRKWTDDIDLTQELGYKYIFQRLAEYENAEEQGLLVRLPCKVGDTVWLTRSQFSNARFLIEGNYVSIRGINRDGEILYSCITQYNKMERQFSSTNIGKTVFLTRADAEKSTYRNEGGNKMADRKYVAISIKHSIYDKSHVPVLWGNKRTADYQKRCFSGYTQNINKCELYSLEDFQNQYGNGYIKCDTLVKMCFDYKKKYEEYDTVLVDFEELKQFLKFVEE